MEEDQKNNQFNNPLDQMTEKEMLAYHAYLMELKSRQYSEGTVEGEKYEKEEEAKPYEEKISQSFLVDQSDEKDKNLCETRAETSNYEESMYSYNQSNQSNYLEDGNVSRAPSTMDHTANTSNFEYRTTSRVDPNETLETILNRELDISVIQSRSEPEIDREEIRRLEIEFEIPMRELGYERSLENLLRSKRSREHLRSMPNLFREDKKTYLFVMDLGEDSDININEMLLKRLEKIDMFLMHKIEIGTEIKFRELLKLFERKYESLRKLFIEREWDLKHEDFKEHGFEFLKNLENQKGLISIEWKSDKLTQKFVDSFIGSYLVSLKELKLDFSEKVVDGETYGKLLEELFININDKCESVNKFNIILYSYVEKFEDLGRSVRRYKKRLEVIPKEKIKEVPQSKSEPSNQLPPPFSQQQQSSHQTNQQPVSPPIEQLSQEMQKFSTSEQSSPPQMNFQRQPTQNQVPQYVAQQQLQNQSIPESLRATNELSQQSAQHENQSQSQIQPAGQNFSNIGISSMLGSSNSNISFGNNTYTYPK